MMSKVNGWVPTFSLLPGRQGSALTFVFTVFLSSKKQICAWHAVNQFHMLKRCVYSGPGALWSIPQIKHTNASFLVSFVHKKLQGTTLPDTMIACNLSITILSAVSFLPITTHAQRKGLHPGQGLFDLWV